MLDKARFLERGGYYGERVKGRVDVKIKECFGTR